MFILFFLIYVFISLIVSSAFENTKTHNTRLRVSSKLRTNKASMSLLTTVFRIVDNECAELHMSPELAYFSNKFGGMRYGRCQDIGYKKFNRTEIIQAGPFGSKTALVYRK